MRILVLLLLTFAALMPLSSCEVLGVEVYKGLPPVTTAGNGTFGCLVNGYLFLPDAPFGFGSGINLDVQRTIDTIGVNLYFSNSSTNHSLIISVFDSPEIQVGKVYNLSDPKFYVLYIDYSKEVSCDYEGAISGTIKFLKFKIGNNHKPFIAGTFEFISSSVTCNDSVTVTSGRFDI